MNFLVDAQLPPALARALSDAGHPSEHVIDLGMRHAKDAEIWKRALQTGQVLITKDEDFAGRAARAVERPAVVWIRLPNCSKRALLRAFLPRVPALVAAFRDGAHLIELRSAEP